MSPRGHSVSFALLSVVCALGCGSVAEEAPQAALRETVTQQGEALNLLCSSGAQCDDGQACTIDLCVAGACVHGPNLGCCEQASDCDQEAACSIVSCVSNSCVQTPIVGCGEDPTDTEPDSGVSEADAGGGEPLGVLCASDAQCEDGDPCTDDICLLAGGVCLFTANPLCCEQASDCDGILACHAGECVDQRCSLNVVPECEAADAGADAAVDGTGTDDASVTSDDTAAGDDVATADDGAEQQGTNTDAGGADTTLDATNAQDDGTAADPVADDADDSTHADDGVPHVTDDSTNADDATNDQADDSVGDDPLDDQAADNDSPGDDDGLAPIDDAAEDSSGVHSDDAEATDDGDTEATDDGKTSGALKPPAAPFAEGPSEGADDADDDGDSSNDAGVSEPGVNAEMTGGACSVTARPADAGRGAWLLLAFVAGALARRRK